MPIVYTIVIYLEIRVLEKCWYRWMSVGTTTREYHQAQLDGSAYQISAFVELMDTNLAWIISSFLMNGYEYKHQDTSLYSVSNNNDDNDYCYYYLNENVFHLNSDERNNFYVHLVSECAVQYLIFYILFC